MSEAPILSVPTHATDKQLITLLKKVLPERLARMGLSKQQIVRSIDELARSIVKHARSCNEAHYIRDLKEVNSSQPPSPELCNEFYDACDQIIRIELTSRRLGKRPSTFKLGVGKIWKGIKVGILGIPEGGDEGENAVIGVRG